MRTYRIVPEIGEGGQARVLKAVHLPTGDMRSIKVLRGDAGEIDGERLRVEAAALGTIHHPNVVRIYDAGVLESGEPYLATELLCGETLAEKIERDRVLPLAEVIRVARGVLVGLDAAHVRGIVHRDIKPSNVFLCIDGAVKLIDFGLCRVRGSDRTTSSTVSVGTPEYFAPEQLDREGDARSDLYSLGCTMVEMLTGWHPFVAAGDGDGAQVRAHLDTTPVLPRRVPAPLRRLILRALSKDPADRPQTARAMLEELEAVGRHKRWPWAVGGLLVSAGAAFALAHNLRRPSEAIGATTDRPPVTVLASSGASLSADVSAPLPVESAPVHSRPAPQHRIVRPIATELSATAHIAPTARPTAPVGSGVVLWP